MSVTAGDVVQTKAERGRFRFGPRTIYVFKLVVVLGAILLTLLSQGIPVAWTADYDRERYYEIRRVIEGDRKRLLDRSFAEVSQLLRLDGVPWDNVSFQQEPGMFRVYHFRGFALYVTLQRFPPGITPESHTPWTASGEELDRTGVLWLANRYPSLEIDEVTDRAERLRRYWNAIEEVCARVQAEMSK
jgi:hypothetical protein